MNLVTRPVAELQGPALDWTVAQAEGLPALIYPCEPPYVYIDLPGRGCGPYHPSYNWNDGGPLIEKHRVDVEWISTYTCRAEASNCVSGLGATPLIATCRAIVASQLGDTVQVPEELLP